MIRTAAVLAVHADAPYLAAALESIDAQDRPVDVRIAVIDHVTPGVITQLEQHGFEIALAASSSTHTHTRIAQNFAQGVAMASDCDLAVLGDHDDIWHAHRVRHHGSSAATYPGAAMYASDGRIVDPQGVGTGATLRMTFPVPAEWNSLTPSARFRYSLRHSVATGGASAVRPRIVTAQAIPAGWLHDRWWSLYAIRHGGLVIDDTIVIDYRITDEQQVGLDTQGQDSVTTWLTNQVASAGRSVRRLRDLSRLVR